MNKIEFLEKASQIKDLCELMLENTPQQVSNVTTVVTLLNVTRKLIKEISKDL